MEINETPEVSFDDVVSQFEKAEPSFIEHPDPEEPKEKVAAEAEDEPEDDDDDEGDEGGEDEEDDEGGDADDEGDDDSDPDGSGKSEEDPETEVEVGGKTLKVPLSELKTLYAVKDSLSNQAQSLENRSRTVETQGLYLAKLYDDRIATATANRDKYAKVDLFDAYRQLEPDEFAALKAAKEAADAEYATVSAEAQNFLNNAINTKNALLRERAKEAIGVIRQAIPTWDDGLYNKVRTYAVSQGMAQDAANEVVDPAIVIMMHKAMLYDDVSSKSKTVAKKAVKAPKGVEPKAEAKSGNSTSKAVKALNKQARLSGDVDDVASAFLAAHRSK